MLFLGRWRQPFYSFMHWLLWSRGIRRRQKVLELLACRGPMTGLDLVKASDGVLKRGQVYVDLSDLMDSGKVRKVDCTHLSKDGCVTEQPYYCLGETKFFYPPVDN